MCVCVCALALDWFLLPSQSVFVCVCVCVCVFDAQFFQIMLKMRGSIMMRPNHESYCSIALSPGFKNWVEMTHNMQQEGPGLVVLPRPASLVRAPVLPCSEAPLSESGVLLADVGGEKPTGAARAHVLGGGERRGGGGAWWRLVLCDLLASAELMAILRHWPTEGQRLIVLAFGRAL